MAMGDPGREYTPEWVKEPQTECDCGSWFCPVHWEKGEHSCPLWSPLWAVEDPYQEQVNMDGLEFLCDETVNMGSGERVPISEPVESPNQSVGESTEMGDDDFEVPWRSEDIVHGKYTEAVGNWPAGMDAKLLEVLEELESSMTPGTFHGMFSDELDVQSWSTQNDLDGEAVVNIWKWAQSYMIADSWQAARDMRVARIRHTEQVAPSGTSGYGKRCMPIALMGTTSTTVQTKAIGEDDQSRDAKEQKKLARYKEYLYEVYTSLGARGSLWMVANGQDEIDERKAVFLAKYDKFTNPQTLSSKLSNWKRWIEWASKNGVDVFTPRDLHVAKYIRSRSRGGPSAANGVYQALLFIETYVGVKLHTGSPNVKAIGEKKAKQAGQAAKQAEIATPSMFLRMYRFCQQRLESGEQGTIVVLVMFVMGWMIACIRAKHAQISWVTSVSARFIHFWCPEGKRKVQGVRIPFSWILPRKMGTEIDIWPYMQTVYQALQVGDAPVRYFIPDIQVSQWEDVGAYTAWQARPMPYAKMNNLYRGLAHAIGVASDWAVLMSSYTPRRFGPTCCGALGYDEEQMQALSNWQEVPEHPGKSSKARFVMSRHYDGSTDLLSGDLKGLLVVSLHQAFDVQDDDPTITKSHLEEELKILRALKVDDGPAKLEAMWMADEWQVGHDDSVESDVRPAVKAKQNPFVSKVPVGEAITDAMDEGTGDDTPSSDSGSSESSEEDGSEDDQWQDQCWFIQSEGGPTHFVASVDWQGQPIPHCRTNVGTPFSRQPHLEGNFAKMDALTGRTRGAHVSCLLKVSPSVISAWKNFMGDENMIQD